MINENQKRDLLEMLAVSSHICNRKQHEIFEILGTNPEIEIVVTKNLTTKSGQNFTFDSLVSQLSLDRVHMTSRSAFEEYKKNVENLNSLAPQNNPALARLFRPYREPDPDDDFSLPLPKMPPLDDHQVQCIVKMQNEGMAGMAEVFKKIPENSKKMGLIVDKYKTA